MQLDDEDTSKYFINYIHSADDADPPVDSSHTEQVQRTEDYHDIDVSTLPNSLIVTSIPQELFTNQHMKVMIICYCSISLDSEDSGKFRMNSKNCFVCTIQKSLFFI